MNKADVEFTVSLNTSPAEQQLNKLYEKMQTAPRTSPLLQQVANEYSQGFKMVGSTYDSGSNRFGVPSTQVLNTALVATTQTLKRFETTLNSVIYMSSRILDDYLKKAGQLQIGYTPSSFSEYRSNAFSRLKMMGNPFSTDPSLVGSTYSGYIAGGNAYGVPSTIVNSGGLVSVGRNVSNWSTSEFYTRDQVDAINYNISHNDIFNDLIFKRKAGKPYSSTYDMFNNIHSPMGAMGMYSIWNNLFNNNNQIGLPAPENKVEMSPWKDKHMADLNKKDNIELKEKLVVWSKILAVVFAVKKVIDGLAKAWKFVTDVSSSRNSNINEELGFFSTDPVGAMRANTDKTRSMLYAGVRNMGANAPVSKAGLDYTTSKFTEMWTAAMSGRDVDARTTIDVQRLKDFFGIDLTVAGLLTGQRDGKTATDIQIDVMKKVETQLSKLNEADEITKGQVIDSLKNVLGEEMIDAIISNYNKNLKIDSDLKYTLSDILLNAGGSALSPQDLTAKTTSAVKALSDFHTALENLKNTITVTFAPAFVSVTNTLTDFVNWLNKKMTKKEGEKDETGGFSSDVAPEAISSAKHINWISKSSNNGNIFGTPSERANKVNELLKNAKSANDVLDAVYLLNPFLEDEGSIEGLKSRRFAREAGVALSNGVLDSNSSNPYIQKMANYQYGGLTGIEAIKQAAKMGEFGNINELKFFSTLLFDPTEFADKTIEDFLPKNYNSLSGSKKTKAYEKAQKKLEAYLYKRNQKRYAAVNQLMSTDFFGNMVMELFGEGGAYDLKEDESIASYLFDPNSYETAEDYYNALKSLKESFDANRWGREYIQSFELPSKEELAGSDKKLDFGEVTFRLTLTDQAGTVLGSRVITGAVQ